MSMSYPKNENPREYPRVRLIHDGTARPTVASGLRCASLARGPAPSPRAPDSTLTRPRHVSSASSNCSFHSTPNRIYSSAIGPLRPLRVEVCHLGPDELAELLLRDIRLLKGKREALVLQVRAGEDSSTRANHVICGRGQQVTRTPVHLRVACGFGGAAPYREVSALHRDALGRVELKHRVE